MIDEVLYVRGADGAHVAYRVVGEPGGVDLVLVAGAFFSLELLAEDRVTSRFLTGLAAIGRVVVFDKRGVGSSDPITDWDRSAQEQWADDLMAVVDAAGLVEPVVISWETMGVARLAVSRHHELGSFALAVWERVLRWRHACGTTCSATPSRLHRPGSRLRRWCSTMSTPWSGLNG